MYAFSMVPNTALAQAFVILVCRARRFRARVVLVSSSPRRFFLGTCTDSRADRLAIPCQTNAKRRVDDECWPYGDRRSAQLRVSLVSCATRASLRRRPSLHFGLESQGPCQKWQSAAFLRPLRSILMVARNGVNKTTSFVNVAIFHVAKSPHELFTNGVCGAKTFAF
jgi:hypothetical protein